MSGSFHALFYKIKNDKVYNEHNTRSFLKGYRLQKCNLRTSSKLVYLSWQSLYCSIKSSHDIMT
jgi:hypothetical protein